MPIRCRSRRSGALLPVVVLGLIAGARPADEPPALKSRAYTDGAPRAAWSDAEHQRFAERVLLIRDPEVLDSVAAWRVPAVIQRAGALGRMEDPALRFVEGPVSAMAGLLDGVCRGVSAQECVERAGFTPLAVVNRLDLARIGPDGRASGAELRFVYERGPAHQSTNVRMIVEFVLKPEAAPLFGKRAEFWAALADGQQRLEALVQAALDDAGSARIRLEVMPTGHAGSWIFRQFDMSGRQWVAAALTGEIDMAARYDASRLHTGKKLAQFTGRQADAILSGQFVLDDGLRTRYASVPKLMEALTLSADVPRGKDREALRHALSVNMCSGCHGPETGNPVFHVGSRTDGQAATVSTFLGGGRPGTISTELVRVNPQRRSALSSDHTEYQYNDLRRRHEFFDVAVRLAKLRSNERAWRQVMRRLAELQARQVH